MRRRPAALCLLLALIAFASGPRAQAISARIDSILAPWAGQGPGVVAIVVVRGEVAFAKAYGMEDVARARPLTLESRFPVDSLTKQFTAAAILRFAHRGALDLRWGRRYRRMARGRNVDA